MILQIFKNKKECYTLFDDYNNSLLNELINKTIFENINSSSLNIIIDECLINRYIFEKLNLKITIIK